MTLSKYLHCMRLLLFISMAAAVSIPAWADTRYVSDQLIISMREGTNPSDPAVTYLIAGTPVEVLEEAENHLHVKIADGKQGWVRSKYILAELPKWMVINNLKTEIQQLESRMESMGSQAGENYTGSADTTEVYELKIKNLETVMEKEKQASEVTRKELKTLKSRHKKLLDDFNSLSKQNASLSKQSDKSAALSQEIKRLKQANQNLGTELENIKQAGQSTILTSSVRWFLIGGGVLLLGFLLGKSVRQKKSYGY